MAQGLGQPSQMAPLETCARRSKQSQSVWFNKIPISLGQNRAWNARRRNSQLMPGEVFLWEVMTAACCRCLSCAKGSFFYSFLVSKKSDLMRLAAPYCYAQTINFFDFSIPVLVLLFVTPDMSWLQRRYEDAEMKQVRPTSGYHKSLRIDGLYRLFDFVPSQPSQLVDFFHQEWTEHKAAGARSCSLFVFLRSAELMGTFSRWDQWEQLPRSWFSHVSDDFWSTKCHPKVNVNSIRVFVCM